MNDSTDRAIKQALAEILDATPPLRPFHDITSTHALMRAGRPERRWRLGVLVGVAVVATLLAVLAWPRHDRLGVTTVATDTSDSSTSIASSSTSVVASSTSQALPVTSVTPSRRFDDFVLPNIGDVATNGGPVELGAVPDGWTQNFALDQAPGDPQPAYGGTDWAASLAEKSVSAQDGVELSLDTGPMLPGELELPDKNAEPTTIAGYRGLLYRYNSRPDVTTPDAFRFGTRLPDDRRLMVSGYGGFDGGFGQLEPLLNAIVQQTHDDGSISFDLSAVTDRYWVVGNTDPTVQTKHVWRTVYQFADGMFSVTTRVGDSPMFRASVETRLVPITVGPWPGYGSDTQLVFWPSPDVSVEFNGNPSSAYRLEQLVQFASSLVPVDPAEWQRRLSATIEANAAAQPDPSCTISPIQVDAVRINGTAMSATQWTAKPGDAIEIDLHLTPGMEFDSAEISLTVDNQPTVLSHIGALTTSRTIAFSWSGRSHDQTVRPGRYDVTLNARITRHDTGCPDAATSAIGAFQYASMNGAIAIFN